MDTLTLMTRNYTCGLSPAKSKIKPLPLMQNCIEDIRKRMLVNKLKLNDEKTEFLIIGTSQKLAKVNRIHSMLAMPSFHYPMQ